MSGNRVKHSSIICWKVLDGSMVRRRVCTDHHTSCGYSKRWPTPRCGPASPMKHRGIWHRQLLRPPVAVALRPARPHSTRGPVLPVNLWERPCIPHLGIPMLYQTGEVLLLLALYSWDFPNGVFMCLSGFMLSLLTRGSLQIQCAQGSSEKRASKLSKNGFSERDPCSIYTLIFIDI